MPTGRKGGRPHIRIDVAELERLEAKMRHGYPTEKPKKKRRTRAARKKPQADAPRMTDDDVRAEIVRHSIMRAERVPHSVRSRRRFRQSPD